MNPNQETPEVSDAYSNKDMPLDRRVHVLTRNPSARAAMQELEEKGYLGIEVLYQEGITLKDLSAIGSVETSGDGLAINARERLKRSVILSDDPEVEDVLRELGVPDEYVVKLDPESIGARSHHELFRGSYKYNVRRAVLEVFKGAGYSDVDLKKKEKFEPDLDHYRANNPLEI